MFKRVMYVTLLVSDQDKAFEFYSTNFGFRKRVDFRQPEGRFLTMSLDEQSPEILLWPGQAGRASVQTDRAGTLFLESDDLRRDVGELKARGVQFVEVEPEDYRFGVRVTALDPDGNPIPLRQRRVTDAAPQVSPS